MNWSTLLKLILVVGLIALIASSFSKPSEHQMEHPNNDPFKKQWAKIDSLSEDGLFNKALTATEALINEIRGTEYTDELVAALMYQYTFTTSLKEEGQAKALQQLETEIDLADQPVKSILQSLAAEKYANFRDRNRWKLQDRTVSAGVDNSDLLTWSLEDFATKVSELYLGSVSDPQAIKISSDEFPRILRTFEETKVLRPSLYDFLANRALDYFKSGYNYLSAPAYKFEITDPNALKGYQTFEAIQWDTRDSQSLDLKALQLYQDLIRFHQNDEDPSALIHTDLARLQYVHEHSFDTEKDAQYLETLEAYKTEFKSNPQVAEVIYLIADYWRNQGNKYQPGPSDAYRYDLKKAYDLCGEAIEKFPDSYGAKQCESLRADILQKKLSVQMEKVNPAKADMLARIDFKNMTQAYLRIIRHSDRLEKELNNAYWNERSKILANEDPIRSWSINLPDTEDHQNHATESIIENLPFGRYYIFVSDNQDFKQEGGATGYTDFHVSNLSLINRQVDGKEQFYVLDRVSGHPVKAVKAEIFVNKYNSLRRRYNKVLIATTNSDSDGKLTRTLVTREGFTIKLTKDKDILSLGDNFYEYNPGTPKPYTRTYFFQDRSIYRPGQTVYWKILMVDYDIEGNPTIKKNYSTTIYFYDTNGQVAEELAVKTNSYGTANGSFITPSNGLLGSMRLYEPTSRNSNYFQVEEYKRPKFETTFKPIEGSYKLEDSVTVVGHAKAFAGNNIDGATVKFRVVREVQFPFWRWWYWGWYNPYQRESMEITNGETITKTNGEFEITFKAIPDRSIPEDQRPMFRYQVYADVIDITGETQSANTAVNVSNIAMQLVVDLPESLDRDQLDKVEIKAQNLNGQSVLGQGTAKLERIKAMDTWYKERYWGKPDIKTIEESTFKSTFPHLAFADEDVPSSLPVDLAMQEIKFDTEMSKYMYFDKKRMKPGLYKLSVESMDEYGNPVELTRFFSVKDSDSKQVSSDEVLYHKMGASKVEPGETYTFKVGSPAEDTRVLYELEFKGRIIEKRWLSPNHLETIDIKVRESHRGNLAYHLTMVQDNRQFSKRQIVNVPWSNKDLKIEYATFRNKLLPGQKEEWQLKLSGPKADELAAEMVATLYDASLDQFAMHNWFESFYPIRGIATFAGFGSNFRAVNLGIDGTDWQPDYVGYYRNVPELINVYPYLGYKARSSGNRRSKPKSFSDIDAAPPESAAPAPMVEESMNFAADEAENGAAFKKEALTSDKVAIGDREGWDNEEDAPSDKPKTQEDFSEVKVRTNLNETVFFYPELKTDKDGKIIISFTMNEALTKWKFLGFAHTEELEYAFTQNEVVTQKELMVVPNVPRFLREMDEIELSAKLSNLSDGKLTGSATLQIFDALTDKALDVAFGNTNAVKAFNVEKDQSTALSWRIQVPERPGPIVYRVIAKAGDKSDGEENGVPVLTNRMMVTETMPLPIRGNETKQYTFTAMKKASESTTLKNHKLTLEFTSNPAWYAVQALPYLMEYPYECTEQIFSRYYANSLASSVANSHPKIQKVFERWKDTDALESNLSKNQELKTALLEETPWVFQSQNEALQKKRIGLLFDLNKMANEQQTALKTLRDRQLSNGGFSWFPGGRDSWYITQYLTEGFGHLDKLGVQEINTDDRTQQMIQKAVAYIDDRIVEHYDAIKERVKRSGGSMEDDHLSHIALHYLYTRSFFKEIPMKNKRTKEVQDYFIGQSKQYWLKRGYYSQGLMALALSRESEPKVADKIVASLKDRALNSEEMGMYWKYNTGWFWYQAPVETHALMIEVFAEVAKDAQAVDDLKVWMLKNKQTTHWKTTKATANAVYALLMNGDNWLLEDAPIQIKLGNTYIEPIAQQAGEMVGEVDPTRPVMEPGTGYFKTSWSGDQIDPNMANVEVKNPNSVVAWGALYWQYFEQMDKIKTFQETPLTIQKDIMLVEVGPTGETLTKVNENTKLEPGDKLTVRIELRVDRDMEYVHMKDMRASGLEPINVLSQYKWQGGLGYYESTRDLATNFFFSYLRKGTYVFEYPLRVNLKGNFSNGITTIQCMYAPEFTSHSEGIRVEVE